VLLDDDAAIVGDMTTARREERVPGAGVRVDQV
jgi:hypothetical protein